MRIEKIPIHLERFQLLRLFFRIPAGFFSTPWQLETSPQAKMQFKEVGWHLKNKLMVERFAECIHSLIRVSLFLHLIYYAGFVLRIMVLHEWIDIQHNQN